MTPLFWWLAYTASASMTAYFLYRLGVERGYTAGFNDALDLTYDPICECEDTNDKPFDQYEQR